MRMIRLVGCLFMVLGIASACAWWAGQARAEAPSAQSKESSKAGFKPVQSIHNMMEGQKKLRSEIQAGILDKKWRNASRAAWILAEIANVNQYQHSDAEYKGFAKKMSDQCVQLAKVLRKRDEKGARTQFKQLGQTCSSCHDKYKDD